MANGVSVDVGISKEEIIRLTKDAIRELVAAQINEAMQKVNVQEIIDKKISGMDDTLQKIANNKLGVKADKFAYERERIFREEAHKAIMEDIAKKPLNGNVYFTLAALNSSTKYGSNDYDD
jgi:transcriptional accessory protein Tex/SPT6